MPHQLDLDDTAQLYLCDPYATSEAVASIDDTAKFELTWRSEHAADRVDGRHVHPYAEGIIRIYRVRTILMRHRGRLGCERALPYLARLKPHDLPPATRQDFFELTYCVNRQRNTFDMDLGEFRSLVHSIARNIDRYMDDTS